MKKIILFLFFGVLLSDPPFSQNTRVSTDVSWDTLNQGENSFVVIGNNIYSICNTAERGDVPIAPYAYSSDGGQNFTQIPFTDNSTGIIWHTDPVIGIDDSGHIHMIIQYSIYELRHYLSKDGGLTWVDTTVVTSDYGVDKPWMVVNKNEIYIVWQQAYGNTGIKFARSSDYGKTFNFWEIWNNTGITALTIDDNEVLHLAIVTWGDEVYYMRSYDKGNSWTTPLYLSDVYYESSYGDRAPINSIAVKGNSIFITWVDTRYSGWDILAVRSHDGGSSWIGPFIVNESTTGGQFKGWAVFDPYGGLHVTYYSTPDWPTNPNSLFSFWYRFSADSGKTFYPEIRVSDLEFLSLSDFLGDYHICVADSEYIYAMWADGRNGDDNDLYFAKAPLSQVKIKENPVFVGYKDIIPALLHKKELSKIVDQNDIMLYSLSGRRKRNLKSGILFLHFYRETGPKSFKVIVVNSR
jgi:hypothetical protein